ncbi:MAG: glycosyltransferase family 4 protein [Ktedonobacteraceae bacterium]|nr:glycosyltransferase family 4 protein [Ktedonobacteraceae bacterium]
MIRKPRIYITITTFYPFVSGAETQTLAQAQGLIKAGHDVNIVTFHHKHIWPAQETVKGVPITRVAGLLLGRREKLPRPIQRLLYLLAMFVMSWTLWQKRNEFDVLQVCQFSLLVLPLSLVCRLAKKPMTIVVISAGADKATKTNDAARLIAGPLDPNLPWLQVDGKTWIDGDLYGLKSAGARAVRYTRNSLKRIGAVVIVLSTRMLRYLRENDFDLPGTQLVPNGVDIDRFQPAPVGMNSEQRAQTVVCVSKARYEKGLDVLLQAWHLVQEQKPEAKLVIVGSGPLQKQLEQMADALGIAQSVEFAGLQSDVPGQLHRGLIGVLPSRWEGMPNALLEAMASGLACVATRVSGSEDLIQHGQNGLLVESENYEEMSKALVTLLKDTALAQKYGTAARATVEQDYTLEHVLSMYTAIYERLASDQKQSLAIAELQETTL